MNRGVQVYKMELEDDGTLDTVVRATHLCGWYQTYRYAEADREEDGAVKQEWLNGTMAEAITEHSPDCRWIQFFQGEFELFVEHQESMGRTSDFILVYEVIEQVAENIDCNPWDLTMVLVEASQLEIIII